MTALQLEDTDLLPDIPAGDPDACLCEVCAVEIPWKGRGRKPTKCAEHKRTVTPVTTARVAGKGTGKNDQLARQAAVALGQLNGMVSLGLMVAPGAFRLPVTASAIANANEAFVEQAYGALLTDPKLCALILKGGAAGGKVALIVAYGMLAAAVVPVALAEIAQNGSASGEDRS